MIESTKRLPEQVNEFTIHPLYCGTIRNHERSGFLYRTDCGGARLNAPCIAWLLRGQTEILLVDTGPGTRTRAGRFYTDDENREDLLLDELLRLDVDPSSLTRVILTHLHNDHVGGAPLLQNARFYVQKAELTEAVWPVPFQRPIYETNQRGKVPAWIAILDRMEVLEGDTEIVPGVRALLLPGHTAGSQGVLINTLQTPGCAWRYGIAGA